MQRAVIGTGHVGLVSGACFADFGSPEMQPAIVSDNRSALDPDRVRAAGFLYVDTGRGTASQWVMA